MDIRASTVLCIPARLLPRFFQFYRFQLNILSAHDPQYLLRQFIAAAGPAADCMVDSLLLFLDQTQDYLAQLPCAGGTCIFIDGSLDNAAMLNLLYNGIYKVMPFLSIYPGASDYQMLRRQFFDEIFPGKL